MHGFIRAAGVAAIAVAVAALPAAAQAPLKVAFVNTQVVFENAPGRTEASATFERETQGLQAQVKQMSDSLNALVAEYQKVEATLTPEQKTTRQRAIQAKQAEYEQRAQQIDQQAGQRREALMTPLLEQVRRAIEETRAEGGYAFILSSEPSTTVLVAYDRNLDITDRVIAKLKAMGPPKTAAAAPAPAAAGPTSSPSGVTRPRTP
jgi:outer membrane protein